MDGITNEFHQDYDVLDVDEGPYITAGPAVTWNPAMKTQQSF